MSQFAEQTQNQFSELQGSYERMKKLTASIEKIVKTLPEGLAQLRKASEETIKRLNQVFEEQHHTKRDRDFLDQDINKHHYANDCTKAKKKAYAIEKVPEEEFPTEDSKSDSMGDAIREEYDEEKDPREEFLVEYQEETLIEIMHIQLEAGMPQDTANQNLPKHTQDAQKFLVTPTKRMEYIHGTATKMTVFINNI
ncbi:hypothetical protein O181_072029 [Austropuccinia psidii MF-1]|uniref:Uncharacterized protein n=1 Tax=Austropuccinia psidii MF-1 TaxID=1389203 RepID=A0A9Q3IB30_9BASI|nr:hypothetical protein [Austropuccinia psidii MF-1]